MYGLIYDRITWLQDMECIKQDQGLDVGLILLDVLHFFTQYEQAWVLVPCQEASLQVGLLCS